MLKVGLHRISYPAPAEIRPNFHIRPDMAAGFKLSCRKLIFLFLKYKHCSVFCSYATIEYLLMTIDSLIWRCTVKYWWLPSAPWCYYVFHYWLHSYVMWFSLGLQLKNIRLQPRPDLQSQIRSNPSWKISVSEVQCLVLQTPAEVRNELSARSIVVVVCI